MIACYTDGRQENYLEFCKVPFRSSLDLIRGGPHKEQKIKRTFQSYTGQDVLLDICIYSNLRVVGFRHPIRAYGSGNWECTTDSL